jgi:signal transduction histidine kinase
VRICTVDLVQEVRRAVMTFRATRPDVDVAWGDDDADPIVVEVDPDRLQQVLTNLLENARRHGGSTKPIEVRVTAGRNGRAGVSIRDHGRGIGVEDQARIFERFFFTADSATRNGGGAGLGLYICQRLMLAMDGAIDVHSIPGSGATFTLQLPTTRRPRRPRTIRRAQDAPTEPVPG